MRLKDKVAIVTGAAWGMGASTAELFAAEGACVMVTDILDAEGTDVVARISDSGGQARFLTLDVTNDTGWASVVGWLGLSFIFLLWNEYFPRRRRDLPGIFLNSL